MFGTATAKFESFHYSEADFEKNMRAAYGKSGRIQRIIFEKLEESTRARERVVEKLVIN